MLAIPQFFKIAERNRAVEGIAYLAVLKSAQLRYATQYVFTSDNLSKLDVDVDVLGKFFDRPNVRVYKTNPQTNATDIIAEIDRRAGIDNAGYGAYTLGIRVNGNITCTAGAAATFDPCPMLGYEK